MKMKPSVPYLPQLISGYLGGAILFCIIRRIGFGRRHGTNTQRDGDRNDADTGADMQRDGDRNAEADPQRDGVCISQPYFSKKIQWVRNILYIASVLLVVRLACIITITRMALIEAATCTTKRTCSIFYSGIIDPVSKRLAQDHPAAFPEIPRRRTRIQGEGIPGRHDSRHARKRGRARTRKPPMRTSCIRGHRPRQHSIDFARTQAKHSVSSARNAFSCLDSLRRLRNIFRYVYRSDVDINGFHLQTRPSRRQTFVMLTFRTARRTCV